MSRYGMYPDELPDGWEVIGVDDEDYPGRILIRINEGDDGHQYLVGEPQGGGHVIMEDHSWIFEEEKWAKLCYGASLKAHPTPIFDRLWLNSVPTNIAIAGPKYIAAFLGMCLQRYGDELPFESPRKGVAKEMDISEQTVSNYWNEVRWEPETK